MVSGACIASRTAGSMISRGASCVCGPCTTRASAGRATSSSGRSGGITRRRPNSLIATGVPLSAIQIARWQQAGYARQPGGGTQSLYFGDRGTESFEGYGLVDLAATYEIPIWRTMRPWIKFELYNLFDNNKLVGWNNSVTPDPASPLDANALPTGYIKPSNFGTARANSDYPRPIPGIDGGRSFLMAFGMRF
jgi:hypothetical protein